MNLRPQPIYLASSSPRRRELLQQVKIPFAVLPFRTPPRNDLAFDEAALPDEAAHDYAERVATNKARFGYKLTLLRRADQRPVLAADTTLSLDGKIIGKPEDAEDAKAILASLSGRTHQVITAIAVAWQEDILSRVTVNEVRFRALSAEDINAYVATGESLDKAGAYAIQGQAARFIEHLSGSYSSVMGLPLFETCALLEKIRRDG